MLLMMWRRGGAPVNVLWITASLSSGLGCLLAEVAAQSSHPPGWHYPTCTTSAAISSNKSVRVVSQCGGEYINGVYTDQDGTCDSACNNQGQTCACTDLQMGNWCKMFTQCPPVPGTPTPAPGAGCYLKKDAPGWYGCHEWLHREEGCNTKPFYCFWGVCPGDPDCAPPPTPPPLHPKGWHYPACTTAKNTSGNTSVPIVSKCSGVQVTSGIYTDVDGTCDSPCNNAGPACVCTDKPTYNWCHLYSACPPRPQLFELRQTSEGVEFEDDMRSSSLATFLV